MPLSPPVSAAVRALVVGAALFGAAVVQAALSVADDDGTVIVLRDAARRIVSLAPHATELLYAAGAGERIVGVLSTSDWPPEAARLPRVGDAHRLDMERIAVLAPDLVVAWPYSAAAEIEALRARGVPVFITNPATIEGIAADIERLGALSGTELVARERASAFRAALARIAFARQGARTVRVFYEIWNEPLYTIGGRHLISEAIRMCGGENVFAALTLAAPGVSVEAVIGARPEAIVAGTDRAVRPAWLDSWRRWADLPAVARGNLYVVDANLLHRPGPRFVDGVERMCEVLDEARGRLK
jgi:iron complex transport system substrate-binding protein